ncbi:lipocalin-like domain-containing protein [Nocardia sp. CC227C]|uniref:lipocalin-like domain-containing protein n=1 Tax=Nocardia sp. CC227C TaxID=3044562 RepID=UPI00278BF223|nr:lipocalin-like domain-containing protein [Nocardia sp. CC227C]
MFTSDPTGVWRLRSYYELDEDGRIGEGPLGPEPHGLLLYHADGFMSVSMMRTGDFPPGSEQFMGYAGRWRIDGGEIVHTVEVSAHQFQVGVDLVRTASLAGDRLTLEGVSATAFRPRRRVLNWQRVVRP